MCKLATIHLYCRFGFKHIVPWISTDLRLAPEVAHVRPWYSWVGGAGGAALGYIVANVPGAVAGGE